MESPNNTVGIAPLLLSNPTVPMGFSLQQSNKPVILEGLMMPCMTSRQDRLGTNTMTFDACGYQRRFTELESQDQPLAKSSIKTKDESLPTRRFLYFTLLLLEDTTKLSNQERLVPTFTAVPVPFVANDVAIGVRNCVSMFLSAST